MNIPDLDVPRVVIIGGGFAGLNLARQLDDGLFQTVLIDSNNYHTFQPLLYQVATAEVEPDSIAYPLRKILKNKKRTHIRMAEVTSIQMNSKEVKTNLGPIHYDCLVIATGASTNFFGNEEIELKAMPMKSLTQSLDLRSLILQNFEAALNEKDLEARDSFMNFVIVGGGPTGVELAGALAELKKSILPKDYPDLDIRRMQIHVIEAGHQLLGPMSHGASENALKYLKGFGVNVWLNTRVLHYNGQHIQTEKQDILSYNLIWAAGVKAQHPKGIDANHIEKGRLLVDSYCFLQDRDDVAAIGDVALFRDEHWPDGMPMLGSIARQQGRFLARHLSRKVRGKKVEAFKYRNLGTMATIGRNKAVVDMGRIHFSGWFAWVTWLFVHLMLLVDFRNRVVVFVNWIWNYLFFDRGTRLIVRRYKRK